MIAVAQESLGFRCAWFAHALSLLIPAFSLLFAPPVLPVWLLRYPRTLPYHLCYAQIRSFGTTLEPRYIVGAALLDQ
jgi:hypothetical protein